MFEQHPQKFSDQAEVAGISFPRYALTAGGSAEFKAIVIGDLFETCKVTLAPGAKSGQGVFSWHEREDGTIYVGIGLNG